VRSLRRCAPKWPIVELRLLLRLTPYVEDETRPEPSACRTKDLAYIGGQAEIPVTIASFWRQLRNYDWIWPTDITKTLITDLK
jgi:hypothetical protein